MSQITEESRLAVVKVIRAENLAPHQCFRYYVKCTVDRESKKTKRSGKGPIVEFNQPFPFSITDTSKLDFELWLHRIFRPDLIVGSVMGELSKLLQTTKEDEDITLILTSRSNEPTTSTEVGSIIIQLKSDARKVAENAAIEATDQWQQTTTKATAAEALANGAGGLVQSGSSVVSDVQPFVALLQNVKLVVDVVDRVAELHPYANAAWSLISAISKVFTSQVERDGTVTDLVATMNATYELFEKNGALKKVKEVEEYYSVLLKQTIECAYFIQDYGRNGFVVRAVQGLLSPADAIGAYKNRFIDLREKFITQATLSTTIIVHRVMDRIDNLDQGITLNDITYAEGMRYQPESCCHPETRKDILEKIISWADGIDPTDESRVFLLTGLAGSGKSSIAHSIAQHFDNLQRLGSSFFCNRTKAANSRPEKIFCTVARDIADIEDQAKKKLAEVVNNNRSLCKTTSVKEQFVKFLKGSTEGLRMVGPVVIVIDALDECEGDDRLRKELMSMLANEAWTLSKNIRIFLTARSGDPVIANAFKSAPHVWQYSTENIPSDSTNADILVRIENQLSSVADELSEYDIEWREHLMKMSGGLFIWAVTACNLISGSLLGPKSQLHDVLSIKRAVDNPLVGLYDLYEQVLRIAIDPAKANRKEMDLYRTTLGAILGTFKPLPTKVIEDLTGENCRMVVSRLGAVLTGSANVMQPVEVLHTSFRDYLTDSNLCKAYFVDTRKHHSQMAKYCLDMMNRQLKFNICGFEDLYILYDDIPAEELTKRTTSNISEALQYACRYWPLHIVQMDSGDYDIIKEPLHRFLFVDKHLMQWIEVVSILRMSVIVLRPLRDLVKWLKVSDIEYMLPASSLNACYKQTAGNEEKPRRLLYDCIQFLDKYFIQISYGPLHLYHSALPYIPTKTVLRDVYSEATGVEPHAIFGQGEDEWWSLRSKLQTSGEITAAVFSSDGDHVACVLGDGKMQVFDFATSAALGEPVECSVENKNSLEFAALALSPKGNHLAISTHESIEVWNLEAKVRVVRDTAFAASIAITFLSNDCVVACRMNGHSVELWSRSLSDVESVIRYYTIDEEIKHVAMSPSGRFFGCLTESGNVFVWDTQSQEEIAHFRVDRPGEDWCALGISSDGEYVAASIAERVTMWSRSRGKIIWEKECRDPVWDILMPLSTDCGRFVTSFLLNYVWDFATGEHYKHKSKWAKAVSPDGQYLVTEKGDIYSIEDADRPRWEPISVAGKADANRPTLLEGEELKHMLFLSDGSLSAAGSNGNTVFIWDRLGTADARKQMLEGHTSTVWDAKISPDGLKLASWDGKNVLRWNRNSVSMQFDLELRERFEIDYMQMAFPPDGSLILASVTVDGTISVWEQFGTANVMKYTLKPHTSRYLDVRFSADGMKVACYSNDDTVFVSAKQSPVARFELSSTHKFENEDFALHYFENPSCWDEENTTPATKECTSPDERLLPASETDSREMASKPLLKYEERSEWVMRANGKRLWWIPDDFRGVSTQLGKRIVVYGDKTAILFPYAG